MIRMALRPLAGSALGFARVRSTAAGCVLLALAAAFACPPATAGCPPAVCTITGDSVICQGQTAELCGPPGNLIYAWSTDDTTQCIHTDQAGTYTLTVTDRETGCSSQCSKDLVVNPAPACTITGPDAICDGETAELCGPEGNYSYLWSTDETTRCITISTEGTYTLTVTDLATGCSSTSGSSTVPTRTAWQMHDGLEVTPEDSLGLLAFNCSPAQHGDPCEYDVATIPVSADPGWGPAPDPNIIDFSIPSRVCYAPIDCMAYGDFTYFQTFVDIPGNVSVTQFTITFSGMDDGSRVTIFNSAYTDGLVVPGSYVFLRESGTTNLAPYVVAGEVNRVVITQVDDCCSENNLRSAVVVLNGQAVTTECSKFVSVIPCPPSVTDAFPIYDNDLPGEDRVDSVVVVFDRPVNEDSANGVEHYSLESGGVVEGALRLDAPDDNRVVLRIRNQLPDGEPEEITVSGVRSLEGATPMDDSETLEFANGVLELDKVNAPDPDGLDDGKGGCDDHSRFLSWDESPDYRVSFTGTVTAAFGDDYVLQDVPSLRAGLWVHVPGTTLVPGRTYVLAGALREIDGETQGRNIVYVRDLGPGPSFVPAIQSVRILTDDTCDDAQLFLTGKDYEGMLVTVDRVVITESEPAGASFRVAIPGTDTGGDVVSKTTRPRTASGPQDHILIASRSGNFTFLPTAGEVVTVTGVLGRVGGYFAIFPRSDEDIFDYGPVPTFSLPLDVSKSATLSRDPDIVRGVHGELFMAWWRNHLDSVHSLSLDNTLNWSQAIPIVHQGGQPALAVTPSNKIGVLGAGVDALFFNQSTDGGHQMDPLITPVDGFPTRYPALTVGSGEHFHAAWERTDAGVFYSRSLIGGGSFSAPYAIALNSGGNTSSMARICASSGDTVFVFWQYDEPGEPGIHRVLYRRSLNGGTTFQPARRVRDESNPITSTVKLAYLGDARIGPGGTVYVMGLDEAGRIAFLKSTNSGQTFDLVSVLPELGSPGQLCPKSFAVGPGGEIHALVGVCGVALYYTRSGNGGATWGAAVNVTSYSSPNVGEPRGAKIILDGTGTPVIVWFSSVTGSTEIYSSRLLN